MSSLSGDENEAIENEPVRRTRSGRAVKAVATPKKTPVKKPTTRASRSKKPPVEESPVEEFPTVEEVEEVDIPENGTEEYHQVVIEPDENTTISNAEVTESEEINEILQPILEEDLSQEIEEIEEIEEVTEGQDVPELEAPPPPVVSNKLPSAPILSTTLKVKEHTQITDDSDGVEIVLDENNVEAMQQTPDSTAVEREMANGNEEVFEQEDEVINFGDVIGDMELSSGVPVESVEFETMEQVQKEQEQKEEQEQEQVELEQEQEQPDEPMEVDETVHEESTEAIAPIETEEEQTVVEQQEVEEEETVATEPIVENVVSENTESNQLEESQTGSTEDDGSKKTEPDTEAVSEDEFPTEAAAKEPETEAVSDEELPAAPPADLGETESVSEDELPPDSDKKRKAAAKAAEKSSEKKAKPESTCKRKLNADGEYDPSSPTSETNDETPAKKAALAADVETVKQEIAKPASPKKKSLPELDKYWKAVNEDPADFTGWTYLLQYVDQENDAEAAREAYNKFLERYPYCYGYWRKYADYEKKKGDPDNVQTVFDKGLKAISLSVDLWLHYINHCKTVYEKDEDKLREQYERAIQACGLEYRSDRLWESYIKWELDGKKLSKVMALYDRLLSTPTLGYVAHFESFQEFVSSNSPNRILSADDFFTIRAEVKALLKNEEIPSSVTSDDAPPGEEPLPHEAPPTDEETRAIREKIISSRRKMHKANDNAVAARWAFEEGIKRPYFHVKPLERCQLKNWKQYLDFEIEQKDQNRIVILFERCLIACALYDEFWLRFIRYLESLKGDNTDKIRDVYQRACNIHHPKKPNLHLQWAAFEESHDNFDKAASILENIDSVIPNMLQIAFRRINLERRRNDYDKACSLYEHYINNSKNRTIGNIIAIKYARFLCKFKNDIDKAIKVLLKAKEQDKENPRLYLKLIDLGLQRSVVDTNEVVSYMDMFIEREHVDLEQKFLFAQRKIEFLEDFSTDIKQILKAHEQFQKCINQAMERKKAKAEDAKVDAASPKRAKAATDSSAVPPPPSANAQSSYQYSSGPSGTYQSQQQFTNSQYGNQSGYQQSYQQYPPPSDPNYANYQNWQYSQSGPQAYGPYNQWGSYNYY